MVCRYRIDINYPALLKKYIMNLNMFELFLIVVVASIITLAVEHGVTGQPETRVFCGQILLGLLFIASVISILSRMSA